MRNITIALIGLVLLWNAQAFAATITGTIVFEGEPRRNRPIELEADPVCMTLHTETIYSESLVLGEGQTLANVLVSVTGGLPDKEYPVPTEPVVLNQKGCVYRPHVFGIRAGQPLKILNPDGTLHNVHPMSKVNTEFNLAMPKFKKTATKTFKEPEAIFPIKCDVHPWMSAWCAVMSHPFFSVTGMDGAFRIEGLGAGTYEIEAWHEKLGTQTATVTIGADETQTANFSFSIPTK